MIIPLPGGWTLELAATSNGSPPDRQGGMSTNVSCQWLRLRWRDVYDTGWHRALRSMGYAAQWWRLVITPKDMIDAWEITSEAELTPEWRAALGAWIEHTQHQHTKDNP